MSAIILIPLVGELHSRPEEFSQKAALTVALGVLLLSVALSFSRGGYIALAVVIAIMVLRGQKRLWSVVVIIVCVTGIYEFLPTGRLETRAESIFTLEDRAAGRLDIWLVAVNMIEHNPILGVGSGNFVAAYGQYQSSARGVVQDRTGEVAHNSYLSVLSELGVTGFALFGLGILMAFKNLNEAKRLSRCGLPLGRDGLVQSLGISLIGLLVAATFISIQYYKYLWLVLALCSVTRLLAREQCRKKD